MLIELALLFAAIVGFLAITAHTLQTRSFHRAERARLEIHLTDARNMLARTHASYEADFIKASDVVRILGHESAAVIELYRETGAALTRSREMSMFLNKKTKELEAAEREKGSLRQRLVQVDSEIDGGQKSINAAAKGVAELRGEMAHVNASISEKRAVLRRLDREDEFWKGQEASLVAELEDAKIGIATMDVEISAVTTRNDAAGLRVFELRREKAYVAKEYKEKVLELQRLEEEEETLKSHSTRLVSDVAGLKAKLVAVELEAAEYQQAIDATLARGLKVGMEISRTQVVLAEKTAMVESMKVEAVAKLKHLAGCESDLEALVVFAAELEGEIVSLSSEAEGMEEKIREGEDRVAAMHSRVRVATEDAAHAQTALDEATSAWYRLEAEAGDLKEEAEGLELTASSLMVEVEDADDMIRECVDLKSDMCSRVEVASDRVARVQIELGEKSSVLHRMDAEIVDLKEQAVGLEVKAAGLIAEVEEASEKIREGGDLKNAMGSRVAVAHDEVSRAEVELKEMTAMLKRVETGVGAVVGSGVAVVCLPEESLESDRLCSAVSSPDVFKSIHEILTEVFPIFPTSSVPNFGWPVFHENLEYAIFACETRFNDGVGLQALSHKSASSPLLSLPPLLAYFPPHQVFDTLQTELVPNYVLNKSPLEPASSTPPLKPAAPKPQIDSKTPITTAPAPPLEPATPASEFTPGAGVVTPSPVADTELTPQLPPELPKYPIISRTQRINESATFKVSSVNNRRRRVARISQYDIENCPEEPVPPTPVLTQHQRQILREAIHDIVNVTLFSRNAKPTSEHASEETRVHKEFDTEHVLVDEQVEVPNAVVAGSNTEFPANNEPNSVRNIQPSEDPLTPIDSVAFVRSEHTSEETRSPEEIDFVRVAVAAADPVEVEVEESAIQPPKATGEDSNTEPLTKNEPAIVLNMVQQIDKTVAASNEIQAACESTSPSTSTLGSSSLCISANAVSGTTTATAVLLSEPASDSSAATQKVTHSSPTASLSCTALETSSPAFSSIKSSTGVPAAIASAVEPDSSQQMESKTLPVSLPRLKIRIRIPEGGFSSQIPVVPVEEITSRKKKSKSKMHKSRKHRGDTIDADYALLNKSDTCVAITEEVILPQSDDTSVGTFPTCIYDERDAWEGGSGGGGF
ncbi:hypothetical protein HDU98_008439 [Podochytrium sp. JEL0797]|nr:hypothetical protein HDU98_008439 [Podochytrium sp. JEL0797]